MFIAMNRFLITLGQEQTFIDMWKNRESHLDDVPGFKEFHLLQGSANEDGTAFISHSIWESKQAFEDWTHSDSFKKAHAKASSKSKPEGVSLYQGPPRFEGFEVVL